MVSGALGEVPGPFGSILDMVAAWKRPKFEKIDFLGVPMPASLFGRLYVAKK